MNGESTPLRGAGMKVAVFDVKVSSWDGLRAESIEEGNFGAAGDAQIGIFQRLLFLWRLWDNFDSFRVEHADIVSTSVEHLYAQHKVFPFVGVGYE